MAQIIAIALLTLLNGLFSLAEMAVVSSRRARLAALAEQGHHSATLVIKLLQNPERFLSTVQVAITAVAIVTGFLGGSAVSEQVAELLKNSMPALSAYAKPIATVAVVGSTTALSIVVGELVPKSIALAHAEAIACFAVRPFFLVMWLLTPFSYVLSGLAQILLRLMRVKKSATPHVTEEEIRVMLRESRKSGLVHASEQYMVENVFNLDDKPVVQLMTPRARLRWIDIATAQADLLAFIGGNPHSYYPVCAGSVDNIEGILAVKSLLQALAKGARYDLRSSLITPLIVPESLKSSKLLELFKQQGQHFAVVVDEYGTVQGVATLHNILEAIVGDMPAGKAQDGPIVRRADGTFLIDGNLPIADFAFYFKCRPEALQGTDVHYTTLAGFVSARLQRLPAVGDLVEFEHGRFEVMDMDAARVDKLLFSPNKVG
ncbi:hemolysin family protein [Turneriella parva]|uniref:HlyC/CorC family transporter n=1 Tax=Turneriella parva (strain ATCC BAA-1111 / DSM 21527 / NCTC 11395 / H) TaxID=869212 RepID=I4B1B5_TURPD|nr:hemolysin family protein [Turneriella parva]AFM11072.1 protein of unknown function DUF21 [Turneriella parva DSM 21527]